MDAGGICLLRGGKEVWRTSLLRAAKKVDFSPDGEFFTVLTEEVEVQIFNLIREYGKLRSDSLEDLRPFVLGFINRNRKPWENKAAREGRLQWSSDHFQTFVQPLSGLGFAGFDEHALLDECYLLANQRFSGDHPTREACDKLESSGLAACLT